MRAANMQALTNDMMRRYPGMTIYGIGDAAHKLSPSDHNEDDTPGSLSEQTDADNVPEHRAIDCMLTAGFTHQEADSLVQRVVADPTSRRRLHYVIWNRHIWEADAGWQMLNYDGDNPHTDHVHFSGLASNDEDASGWPVVFASSGSGPVAPRLRRPWPAYMRPGHYFGLITGPNESHGGYYASEQPDVRAIQERLNAIGYNCGAVDGIFGPKTKAAVSRWQSDHYAATTSLYGQVWSDDWAHLFTY